MRIHAIRLSCLLALAAVAFSGAVGAAPAGFTARGKAAPGAIPAYAKPGSGLSGTFDPAVLKSPTIVLALPDGRSITAHQSHLARTPTATTWRGTFAESPRSSVTLTLTRGVVSGWLLYGDEVYELQPGASGGYVLYAVDDARLPPMGPLVEAPHAKAERAQLKPGADAPMFAVEGGVVHDLLVVTTAASRAAGGVALEGRILTAVADANAAYQAGNVGITLHLVDIQPSTLVEGTSMDATLDTLRRSAELAARRDDLGADLVLLVAANSDYCGIGYFMSAISTSFAPFGYSVVSSFCLSNYVLTHELGHNQGLAHDRETWGPESSSTPYAFGYRDCIGGVRDIMSYPCTSGSAHRINQFSNPRALVNGRPFGVDYESDPLHAADAVRALNDSAATVAAFHTPATPTTVPAAPGNVRASAVSGTRIDLSWDDNSSDETGFVVERSRDGVNWAQIADLSPGTTSHADQTVAAGVYSYRVQAYNSAGFSPATAAALAEIDVSPDAAAFTSQGDVTKATVITSNAVTVSGITVPVPVAIRNGAYSIGCTGTFTAAEGTLASGERVCVRHTSAATASTSVVTTLDVGTASLEFVSTTAAALAASSSGSGSGGGGAFDLFGLLGLLGAVAARLLPPTWRGARIMPTPPRTGSNAPVRSNACRSRSSSANTYS